MEEARFDFEKTYGVIRKAALERRFVSYSEVAAASDIPWRTAWRPISQHLGQFVMVAHERGWPLLSAIVVNKEDILTGKLDGESRDGLISAARKIGMDVNDPDQFVKEQQEKVFAWAATAPETLNGASPGNAGQKGPQFVHYLGPVLNALRALGGEAKPKDVVEWIKNHEGAARADVDGITKGGNPSFENRIGWARFYLVKGGLVDDSRRGIWKLTQEGRDTNLDFAAAMAVFKDVRAAGWSGDDENGPAPVAAEAAGELFDDPTRQFWFAGAAWGKSDQSERFIKEGIWQNGYDKEFTDLVRKIRKGDRIAIKSSFVRKRNLPFDAAGKSVSCMRIKAIGVVTNNPGDGKTVQVDWTPLDPQRDWFLYTYRMTLHEADPNDELDRQAILFAFGGLHQDYEFWMRQPYFARKFATSPTPTAFPPYSPEQEEHEPDATADATETERYLVSDIVKEGCFLSHDDVEAALQRLREKKNIILQGPPGTGKTWLARRLACALIGTKDRAVTRTRIRSVQFHPSLSYEDFVRGWRPASGGKLELVDGIFLKLVQAAAAVPEPFVLIIEEINRGNPAQVFGEMLTLLEDTKRRKDEALELAYGRDNERVHIPPNLYVIGTMNIADRSLALVDLALRRRFAFVSLEPQLGPFWRAWCAEKGGLDPQAIELIQKKMEMLNAEIADDRSLGAQFRIGHSYFTPPEGAAIPDGRAWFSQVIKTQIAPLLEEYWFDEPLKAKEAVERLLAE